MVDLWQDLESERSRHDFLHYQQGWIAHVVLLGCFNSIGPEVAERVIEIACFLDLHCQEHDLAVATIRSLQSGPISRLTTWGNVQHHLIHKMEEIIEGTFAKNICPAATFRAPRDASLEYWILTRAYVDDKQLWTESLAVEPQINPLNDVETRITQLEALLTTIRPEESSTANSDPQFSDIDHLTDFTDTESSDLSSSDLEFDNVYAVHNVAQQARDRISKRLEALKTKVSLKIQAKQDATSKVHPRSITASTKEAYFERVQETKPIHFGDIHVLQKHSLTAPSAIN